MEQFDTELEAPAEAEDEVDSASAAKAKWTTLERIVGNAERIRNLAADIVSHYEGRQEVFKGKAMIVAMSRQIAVDLYDAIVALRPDWHDDDLAKGAIKVIMTSASSDGPHMQKHHTTKTQRKMLAQRMKDENDPLRIVIVRDMWLTGFDAPCLNTMYVDKPMQGHNLMQAIARVNRVFKDKPGGLIVDYIGIGTSLREALNFYAESGGKGMPAESQQRAVEIMMEKLEVVRQILRDFDYSSFFTVTVKDKLSIILRAENHILGLENGKNRFLKEVTLLGQAYALSKPDPLTFAHAEEIAFFQAVKARLSKFDRPAGTERPDYDSVIKNIVASAIESDRVVDVFEAAGIEKPDISILSEQFLQEVRTMEYKCYKFLTHVFPLFSSHKSVYGQGQIPDSNYQLPDQNYAADQTAEDKVECNNTYCPRNTKANRNEREHLPNAKWHPTSKPDQEIIRRSVLNKYAAENRKQQKCNCDRNHVLLHEVSHNFASCHTSPLYFKKSLR